MTEMDEHKKAFQGSLSPGADGQSRILPVDEIGPPIRSLDLDGVRLHKDLQEEHEKDLQDELQHVLGEFDRWLNAVESALTQVKLHP